MTGWLLALALVGSGLEIGLQPGQHLWVGHGMARGYDLPFGQKLTIKRVRVLLSQEARLVFEEYPRRFYLRADFADNYAFRGDPYTTYDLTDSQWQDVRAGHITLGMSKRIFLLIRERPEEINRQEDPGGPVEQWIYRDEPSALFGRREQNPPTAIYYFQNDILIAIL